MKAKSADGFTHSSDQQVEVAREVLYDRGRDFDARNPQVNDPVVIFQRYGLHSDRGRDDEGRVSLNRDVVVREREDPPLIRRLKVKGPRLCH
jgi:hypothetical protein